jgi:peptidoglycan/LPS O-acetylase OafA/YrhL
MFLGVCLHAAVSYMSGRVPGLLWVVRDQDKSRLFDVLFWGLHSFRLPLFFGLAGFFAALVADTRGPGVLLGQRVRRLLVPYLVGSLVLLPITYYIWAAGWLAGGHCTLRQILAVKFRPEIQAEVFGPLHLWFLQDLFLLSLGFCLIWGAGRFRHRKRLILPQGPPRSESAPRPWVSWSLPLWLSVPTALVLAVDLRPFVAHHNSFLPDAGRLLYYGLFFASGVALCSRRDLLADLFRPWGVHLALSVPVGLTLLLLLPRHLAGEGGWGLRLALAAALALLAWLLLFGMIGLALRCFPRPRPLVRYLADASYWVYLAHLPVVGLLQLDLAEAPLPAGLKFLGVVSVTVLLCLASYHTLVRYTWIGAILHGRRARPTPRGGAAPALQATLVRATVLEGSRDSPREHPAPTPGEDPVPQAGRDRAA